MVPREERQPAGRLLSTDENSNRIGEVAFVPASAPSTRGVLFFNTLFDGNAACHIAFGAGYPTNIKGRKRHDPCPADGKGPERLRHPRGRDDPVPPTPTSPVPPKDGQEVTIFVNGEWAFLR